VIQPPDELAVHLLALALRVDDPRRALPQCPIPDPQAGAGRERRECARECGSRAEVDPQEQDRIRDASRLCDGHQEEAQAGGQRDPCGVLHRSTSTRAMKRYPWPISVSM